MVFFNGSARTLWWSDTPQSKAKGTFFIQKAKTANFNKSALIHMTRHLNEQKEDHRKISKPYTAICT